jgi:hypothetical protein
MFQTGAPLGEVVKSCQDELVLACEGEIRLGLYGPDGTDADHGIREIMRGGAANRVLYGDPAFAPFAKVESLASPRVTSARSEDGSLAVTAEVTTPFSYGEYTGSECVDQFCGFGSRLLATLDLPAEGFPHGVSEVGLSGDPGTGAAATVVEVRWAVEVDGARTRLHLAAFSKKPAGQPGGLGTEKGQTLTFRVAPAGSDAERRWAGTTKVRVEGGQVDAALAQAWGYEWKDRKFAEVLSFVTSFLEKHGDGQKVAFEFDEDAKPLADRKVTLKLDGEPLRAGLERLCAELGLTMSVDSARNVVRFSKAK